MKITEDRLAVALAVLEKNGSWLLPDEIRAVIAAIPEPPDDSPATLPAPDVQALRGQIESEVWEARKRVEAALSAEIVELRAQIDAPPAGYADRAFTDAEWAMRYAEKCRERDDALAARDECAPLCEKHRADEQWRGLTDCLACATEELEARVTEFDSQIDTAREQLSAREQSATNLAALAADPDNEGLHTAPMMTPDWTTRDLLRTYWREHVKDQKQLIYLARVATGADTHGVTELDRRGMEIRDALLRGYEQNEDLCFLDEVRHENERLKAQIDAARAEEREKMWLACSEVVIKAHQKHGYNDATGLIIAINNDLSALFDDVIRARSGARGAS